MATLNTTDKFAVLARSAAPPPYDAAAAVRILFVEDSEDDLELMQRTLHNSGFPVADGTIRVDTEAGMRAALAAGQWDVVISDYRMPRFSAQAALSLLKATGMAIPFLMVSGAVGEDVAVQAMRDGADDYVMKHNLSRLPAALALALERASIRRQHQHAQQSLHASENYLRTLFTTAPVAIIAFDKEHQISLFNPAALALFPQLSALLGRHPPLTSEDNQQILQRFNQLMQSGETFSQRPVQWNFGHGRKADLLVSAAPLRPDGTGAAGAVLFALDVSEQKKAEAAQRESESRVAAISANLPGVLFRLVYEPDTGTTSFPYMSPGAASLFGMAPEQFVTDPARFMNLFDAASQEQIRAAVAAALASGTALHGDWRIRRPDATEAWIQISASVQQTASGGGFAFDGVITDLSAQKLAQADLTQSREELRRLTAHMETLKESERREVAREIHDDIGSTLAGLKANVAWLHKRIGDDSEAAARLLDMSGLIDGAVQSANRIISSLRPGILDFGIGAALDWQVTEFGNRMGFAASFKTNQEDVTMDLVHSTVLFRVLQEALTNIAKHAHASSVAVEMFANSGSVNLEIRDDGIGLQEADKTKSTSFGLRGMLERVRAIGGWLDISASPGAGTTLMVSVPRRDSAPATLRERT